MTPDDLAKAQVRDEFDHLAGDYEKRWQKYVSASVRETLRRTAIKPGESLLDVGCGPGTLLQQLKDRGVDATLAGVDLSTAMIARARRRLRGTSMLAAADAERLALRDDTFDVVVSSSSLHFWPTPERGLAELRRVLRPGGRLIMTDWCDDFLACRLCDRFLRWWDPAHQRIYSDDECARLLRQSGFAVKRIEKYKVSWLWGLMTAVAERP